jgi:hypothetical protein
MGQSRPWEDGIHSDGQNPWLLRNHLVYYSVYKGRHFTLSWITDLAQDRDRWRAYVKALMNLRVP